MYAAEMDKLCVSFSNCSASNEAQDARAALLRAATEAAADNNKDHKEEDPQEEETEDETEDKVEFKDEDEDTVEDNFPVKYVYVPSSFVHDDDDHATTILKVDDDADDGLFAAVLYDDAAATPLKEVADDADVDDGNIKPSSSSEGEHPLSTKQQLQWFGMIFLVIASLEQLLLCLPFIDRAMMQCVTVIGHALGQYMSVIGHALIGVGYTFVLYVAVPFLLLAITVRIIAAILRFKAWYSDLLDQGSGLLWNTVTYIEYDDHGEEVQPKSFFFFM